MASIEQLAVLWLMVLGDIGATYLSVLRAGSMHELNPIARAMWKLLGLRAGSVVLAALALSLVTILVSFSFFAYETLWYLAGAYTVVLVLHYHNLRALYGRASRLEEI